MAAPRMFRVLVLGGVALVGAQACGGSESSDSNTPPSDAAESGTDTFFPGELPTFVDTGVDTAPETFPGELPSFIDTGTDVADAADASDTDDVAAETFPGELPAFVETGAEASAEAGSGATDVGFPKEA